MYEAVADVPGAYDLVRLLFLQQSEGTDSHVSL